MNKGLLLAALDASAKDCCKVLGKFDENNFACKPSDEQWSAAEVAEHLWLLEVIALHAVSGASIPTNREADAKLALIKWSMEGETKRIAPDRVLPTGRIISPQQAIEKISLERNKFKEAISSSNVTDACTSLKHPSLGTFTKWEWGWFTIHHMERHLTQLQRLL